MQCEGSTIGMPQPSFVVDMPVFPGRAGTSKDTDRHMPRICDAGSGLAVDTHRGERRSRARARARANNVLLSSLTATEAFAGPSARARRACGPFALAHAPA
jgi:hypothetical protein